MWKRLPKKRTSPSARTPFSRLSLFSPGWRTKLRNVGSGAPKRIV